MLLKRVNTETMDHATNSKLRDVFYVTRERINPSVEIYFNEKEDTVILLDVSSSDATYDISTTKDIDSVMSTLSMLIELVYQRTDIERIVLGDAICLRDGSNFFAEILTEYQEHYDIEEGVISIYNPNFDATKLKNTFSEDIHIRF